MLCVRETTTQTKPPLVPSLAGFSSVGRTHAKEYQSSPCLRGHTLQGLNPLVHGGKTPVQCLQNACTMLATRTTLQHPCTPAIQRIPLAMAWVVATAASIAGYSRVRAWRPPPPRSGGNASCRACRLLILLVAAGSGVELAAASSLTTNRPCDGNGRAPRVMYMYRSTVPCAAINQCT